MADFVLQLWWTNILLLGFEVKDYSRKYPGFALEKVSFGPQMFRVGNEKGLLVVLHFLLDKMNAEFHQDVVGLWPFYDRHTQGQFKRVAHRHLEALVEQGLLPIAASRASLLTSAKGHGVVELVGKLAHECLKKCLAIEFGEKVTRVPKKRGKEEGFNSAQSKVEISKALQVACWVEHHRLEESFQKIAGVEAGWRDFMMNVDNQVKVSKQTQVELRQRNQEMLEKADRRVFNPIAMEERTRDLQKVRNIWKRIDDLAESRAHALGKKMCQRLDMQDKLHQCTIDGQHIVQDSRHKVMNSVEMKKESEESQVKQDSGVLDVSDLAERFTGAIKKLSFQIQQLQALNKDLAQKNNAPEKKQPNSNPLCITDEYIQTLQSQATELKATEGNLLVLRQNISETLNSTEERVRILRSRCHSLLGDRVMVEMESHPMRPIPPTPASKGLPASAFLKTPARTRPPSSIHGALPPRTPYERRANYESMDTPPASKEEMSLQELSASVRKIWKTPHSSLKRNDSMTHQTSELSPSIPSGRERKAENLINNVKLNLFSGQNIQQKT